MGVVFCGIAVDDQGIADFHVAFFPAAARECSGTGAFAAPVRDIAFLIFHIDEEIGMRIGPLDFRDRPGKPYGAASVVLGSKRMVGVSGNNYRKGGYCNKDQKF